MSGRESGFMRHRPLAGLAAAAAVVATAGALIATAGAPGAAAPAPRTAAPAPGPRSDPGKEIYETVCAACHQVDGGGVPGVFPPLVGTRWVTGDPERLLKVLLHGLEGEIEVLGTVYAGLMAPVGGALDDAGIAAIATYIRSSWGNEAAPITRAQAARVRAAHRARTAPWTQAELGGPPDGGS